jgi:hypothetical protein
MLDLRPVSDSTHSVTISFATAIVKLTFAGFDTEIDMDKYTSINYSNIYSELITITPLMNRVGMWRADAENAFKTFKLECEVYQAQVGELFRKNNVTTTVSSGNVKFPSDERIKRNILLDSGVQLQLKKLYRLEKEVNYMEAFYWSLKDKADKLNKISERMNLTPVELEKNIVEGAINGYLIKKIKRQ